MTHAQRMVRLHDGTVVPASSLNGVLPPGASVIASDRIARDGEVIHAPFMIADGAPASAGTFLNDGGVMLTDAERMVVDVWGPGTEWLTNLPSGEAGGAKSVISDAASGGPDGASAATDLSARFATMADQAHRPAADRDALRKGSAYLRGMSRAAHALGDGSPGAADTKQSAYAAMCDGLENAWRS